MFGRSESSEEQQGRREAELIIQDADTFKRIIRFLRY